jgi:4-aminobutyrate aminotransferase-like enzyme
VEAIGQQIRAGFEALADKYPIIGNIRGRGCMQGLELVKDRATKEPANEVMSELFEATRKRGLLIGAGGVGNAFRFTPPLVARTEHINQALELLDEALADVMETVQ